MLKFVKSGLLVLGLFTAQLSFSQGSDLIKLLDSATGLQAKGDKENLSKVLTSAVSGIETEANSTKSELSGKLLSQAGLLKKLIPLAQKGLAQKGALEKIVNTVKMLLGANKISNLLGSGSSLLGQASTLKSSLGLIRTGMSVLGGGESQKLGSLVSTALGSVGKLEKGGITGKAAEPVLKSQLGGITNMIKGLF